jgi:hypothetical protein
MAVIKINGIKYVPLMQWARMLEVPITNNTTMQWRCRKGYFPEHLKLIKIEKTFIDETGRELKVEKRFKTIRYYIPINYAFLPICRGRPKGSLNKKVIVKHQT